MNSICGVIGAIFLLFACIGFIGALFETDFEEDVKSHLALICGLLFIILSKMMN